MYNEAITRVFRILPSSFPSVSVNYSSSDGAIVICVELVEHSKSQSQSAIMMIVYQSMQRSAESSDNVTHYVTYDLWNFETFHKGVKIERAVQSRKVCNNELAPLLFSLVTIDPFRLLKESALSLDKHDGETPCGNKPIEILLAGYIDHIFLK